MAKMTAVEIEQAHQSLMEDGYVVLTGVVNPDDLDDFAAHLAQEYRRAQTDGRLFEGGGSFSGHLNCFPGRQAKFIGAAVEEHGVIDIVRAHSPDVVDHVRATTNYNLPNSHPQHYHADGLFTEAFLICNVAVVDTDLQNGAIDVLPGTHRRFYKFWRYALERKFRDSTRISMQQGDVLLRISTMWHRGMPNFTDTPRPMMSLTFGETSGAVEAPFEVDGGDVTFTPNWYGTDRLSQIREKIFVRAPWTYSSLRFSRSLVGNKGYSSW